MAMALRDPDLKAAMDQVSGGIGSDKWRAGIEAVAGSMGLSDAYTAQYIEQQVSLAEKVTELETSIAYMEDFKTQIESDAAQGIPNHYSPEMAAEKIAEMEADIQELKDKLYGNTIQGEFVAETAGTPTPEPSAELHFIAENKTQLASTIEDYPASSREDLIASIEEMGCSPQQAERVVAELAKMPEFVALAPELFAAEQTPAQTATDIQMKPEETQDFAAANTGLKPLDNAM